MDPTRVRENNWAKTHNSTDPSQDAGTKKINHNNHSTGSSPSQPEPKIKICIEKHGGYQTFIVWKL